MAKGAKKLPTKIKAAGKKPAAKLMGAGNSPKQNRAYSKQAQRADPMDFGDFGFGSTGTSGRD